jgi:hypothetical protein
MRQKPAIIVAVALIVVLQLRAASADPIPITGGVMNAEIRDGIPVGTVDVHGTQGFRAQLGLDLTGVSGPWICCPALFRPGTPIDLRGFFDADDGGGTVELNGVSYPVPSTLADVGFRPLSGPVIAPALSERAVLSSPFDLQSGFSFLSLFDFGGEPTVTFPLLGRGTATLELTPEKSVPAWAFVRVRYEFESAAPSPEPASLFLLAIGVAGIATRAYAQRHEAH